MLSTELIQCYFCYYSYSGLWVSSATGHELWLRGQTVSSPLLFSHAIPAYFPVPPLGQILPFEIHAAESRIWPLSIILQVIFKVNHRKDKWIMWKQSFIKTFIQVLFLILSICSACTVAANRHNTLLTRKLVREFSFMQCNNNQIHNKAWMQKIEKKKFDYIPAKISGKQNQLRNTILFVKMLQGAYVPELEA